MQNYKENAVCDWTSDSIRLIVTPSRVAKSTYFYVQEVGYFKTQPKYYTEREGLNSYLIVYTISGKGYLKYKDKSYTILPNQVFFINCMEYQYYKTDEQEPWEILWIHFNGSTSCGYYEEFEKNNCPITVLDKPSTIPSILKQIIKVHQHMSIHTESICSKLIVELLTELLVPKNIQETSTSFLPEHIKLIKKDMDNGFNEKITLDQLAHKYLISKFYMSKEFKKFTGFSPNEYLINNRITYAKEQLRCSNLSVSEISSKVGIDNVSHFINLFKDREGKTPLAYRKEWQFI